jgi:hypothetical protein
MAVGKLNDEIGRAKGRGLSDDGKGATEKRMRTIRDGHMTTYLIHHWGIVICALFSISNRLHSTTTWWKER